MSNRRLFAAGSVMEEVTNDVLIRFMRKDDIEEILLIEQCSFPAPWSARAFLSELENKFARYFVLLEVGRVIGYAGMWLFAGEAHITTIAVHPNYRNQGYGRLLMNFLIDFSQDHGVDTMILEVRVSNIPAIKLYSSLGFKKIGIRKNYYLEIHEDAIVMLRKFNQQNDMGEGEQNAD
jgi:ribosomal-protein-alanine N-acetyltransferase